jgi:sugar lactone lactonase YvrE
MVFLLATATRAHAQTVSTYAGSGTAGFINGAAATVQFTTPAGTCADAAGNIYVADANNHRIRKIDGSGNVTTYAGSGIAGFADGAAAAAQFNFPTGVCADAAGNIYVADFSNHRIRKINGSGNVTTYAGNGVLGFANGSAATAQFFNPSGVCTDALGNIYVAEASNHRIRKIDGGGNVSTYAGSGTAGFANGVAVTAQFNFPYGVCADAAGNIYVADAGNHRIRKIDGGGNVSTYAGNGTAGFANGAAATAQFNNSAGVCADAVGNIYVADNVNSRIRKIDGNGNVTTYAGSGTPGFADGAVTTARFNTPNGVCADAVGNIYVADAQNHRIRKISYPAPTLTFFSPSTGSPGKTVVLTGSGFIGTTAVSFGGIPAASFTVNSDTQITAVIAAVPVSTAGPQLVIVTTPNGTVSLGGLSIGAAGSSAPPGGPGSTTPAPQSAVIGSISSGVISFGTPITLTGSGFTGATGLLIGGVAVTNFVVVNDNTITAVVGGVPVNDRVQLVGGLGANLDMSGLGIVYQRATPPVVASIGPSSLVASGDDAVLTISGSFFLAGARVLVSERNPATPLSTALSAPVSDGQPIGSMQSLNSTRAVVTLSGIFRSPGDKIITLLNPDGQFSRTLLTVVTGAAVRFTRLGNEPVVFTTTASGRAFSLRLWGANIFRTVRATLNDAPARVTVLSSTEAIVEVPASVNDIGGISLVIRLQNSDGSSTTATFRIGRRPPPTIVSVTLQSATQQSDTRLQVRGVNFLAGIRSTLGSTALTLISQDGDVAFTAQIPSDFRLTPNSPTVLLTVQNMDGSSHGVLLARSMFEGEMSVSSANGGNVGQTFEAGAIAELQEAQAGKQQQSGSQELSIYPNPVEGELRVGGVGMRLVKVYDMRGAVVLEERTTSGVVNVAALSAGAYMVVVEAADGHILRQRVVKR